MKFSSTPDLGHFTR